MNQIVPIFRKDCRRLWQIIAAVLVFTFLHGYGDATIPTGSGMAVGLSPYMIVFRSSLLPRGTMPSKSESFTPARTAPSLEP